MSRDEKDSLDENGSLFQFPEARASGVIADEREKENVSLQFHVHERRLLCSVPGLVWRLHPDRSLSPGANCHKLHACTRTFPLEGKTHA
jgi:hypothetical protein